MAMIMTIAHTPKAGVALFLYLPGYGGGSEATGGFFFSQHPWGFFKVADLGYLSVFFNLTRIYSFWLVLCIFVTTKTNGKSEVSLKRGKTQSNLGQTRLNVVCRVPPCVWVVVGQS